MADVVNQWQEVRRQIADRAQACGRAAVQVRLLAVSKTFPAEAILQVYQAGQRCFAENKAQELAAKAPQLPADIEWHFIGHLQSNKVQQVLRFASWIHSVDSVKLVQRMDRIAGELGKRPVVLLELNLGGESCKTGAPESELADLAKAMKAAQNLEWRGLMCMAPLEADEAGCLAVFNRLRTLRDRLEEIHQIKLPELSMGMSHDFPLAIAAGATLVRVGSAIFGTR